METDSRAANRVELDATLIEKSVLRYTPAGIAVQEGTLAHRSMQMESNTERQTGFELFAVAFGDTARALDRIPTGRTLRCHGFLCRRWRTGITLALHITRFEPLNIEPPGRSPE